MTKNMTTEEAYSKRYDALLLYLKHVTILTFPYTKNDLNTMIILMSNVIKAYDETKDVLPIDDESDKLIDVFKGNIACFTSQLNHPAFA